MSAARSYAALPQAISAELVEREDLTVSQWADRYRVIPPGTSPEPGPWRTERAPYLKEILDSISDPTIERVAIQAASQVGKSEIVLSAIGYFAHQEPAPILLVQATEIAMRGFSKERVAPMFSASPALRGKLSQGARDPNNTIMLRQFPGGLLACAWAGSASSLASRPIRVVLGDELDRWPDETVGGRDGDPWAQAVQRTSNFHNRKIIAVSTPNVEGVSRIARLYEDSDQRRYHVPCPHCGALQVLEWSGVIYKRQDGAVDLDQVHYRCAHCRERIEERSRPAMIESGEWKAENPGHHYRGYTVSGLYSPWVRWRELAAEWIKATSDRDKHGLQEFVNLRLGEVWKEYGDKITVEELEKNREPYAAPVPDPVLLLTAGIDVQDDRFEAEVVGWGMGRESWGVEYVVIPGDTSRPETWNRLDEWLLKTWSKADGRPFRIVCAFVDSGGHRTQETYRFTKERLARQVFSTKGRAGQGLPLVGKSAEAGDVRARLYPIGADTGKEMVFSRLALSDAGPGFCHFPISADYDDEYFKGLVSETQKRKKGGGLQWVKTRARNEPLDVRVLTTAAMESMVVNWAALALAEEKVRAAGSGSGHGSAPAAAPRRRVLHKGVE